MELFLRLIKLNWISRCNCIHRLNQKWKNNYNLRSTDNLFSIRINNMLPFSSLLAYFISKLVTFRNTIVHLSRRSSFKQSSNQSFTPTTLLDIIFVQNTHCSTTTKALLLLRFLSSPVFELQHHCSKPTSKRSWQWKSIFRLDIFI